MIIEKIPPFLTLKILIMIDMSPILRIPQLAMAGYQINALGNLQIIP